MDALGWNQVRKAIKIVRFIEDNRSMVTATELVETLQHADLDGAWGALVHQVDPKFTPPSDEVKELVRLLADLTTFAQERHYDTDT